MKRLMKTQILIVIAAVAAFCGNAFAAVPAPGSTETKEMLIWWEQNVRYKALNEKLDRTLQKLDAACSRVSDTQSAAEKRQKKALRANEAKLHAELAEIQAQLATLREQLAALQSAEGNALQNALAASDAKSQKTAAELRENFGAELGKLQEKQNADRAALAGAIGDTAAAGKGDLQKISVVAAVVALVLVAAGTLIAIFLSRKIGRSKTALAETDKALGDVRSAQGTIAQTLSKLQEASVALDGKLLEILEKQLEAAKTASAVPAPNSVPAPAPEPSAPDHSFPLKIADEIARIEKNLSRMDSSVKGHKQLMRTVQRMKDNFRVNGYEIVDMLGKPFDDRMIVTASFKEDETLPQGTRVITGIEKPQVNFNGKMIRIAEITVSQNI